MIKKLLEFAVARTDDKISNHSVWNRVTHSWQQHLLVDLCKHAYGMVPDGETSAGHQKFRARTPQEAVALATELMDRILAESERRGYLLEQPPFDELREQPIERPGFINGRQADHAKP